MSDRNANAADRVERLKQDPRDVDSSTINELIRSEDKSERRLVADALLGIAESDPEFLVESRIDSSPLLEDESPLIRNNATLTASSLATDFPDEIANQLPALLDLLADEDSLVRANATKTIAILLSRDPEAVAGRIVPAIPRLIEQFGTDLAVDSYVLHVLQSLAEERPKEVAAHLETLLSVFDDEYVGSVLEQPDLGLSEENGAASGAAAVEASAEAVQQEGIERRNTNQELAAITIAKIVDECPEAVPELVSYVEPSLDNVKSSRAGNAMAIVGYLAEEHTDNITPLTDKIAAVLIGSDDVTTKVQSARTLALIAERSPERVSLVVGAEMERVLELLDVNDTELQAVVLGLLSYVAEIDPETVEQGRDRFVEFLDHENAYVRGNTVLTLKFVDPGAVPANLASSDPDEYVREMAAGVDATAGEE